ncbi:50S ribosomal protein L21 [Parvibaculum sp.]|jgi:large subunit ribosomal protein L21|uniref:50S ribosomal protein L21 n=1 Tax=Parvibaculum sp. TaxID=2024848 RepID=UPI000C4750D6|nr:50S ribosomal protein L21 [Parvibaculum sp.]HAC58652.1 50S ribosomal protein L21 [Rhodobiaceae bacterium]MAU60989.1 50S ribosomal protein L21 [Parvibaculum sp.]MBO6668615.1 50S ribosomal protein L21 [Parvibaculum sp.]MBO6691065.1 50S ribosomal protein L21 [Parvibaculum sp.]MBO6714291.1 50S ribosomal protein L21 [Parvibaculum sp.]
MFAVIRTGGKQYRVAKDDLLEIERLDAKAGDKIELGEVLMLGGEGETKVGAPLVDGAKVKAEVVDLTRGPKLTIFKKRRRQNYRRKNGHRQDLMLVKILDIAG